MHKNILAKYQKVERIFLDHPLQTVYIILALLCSVLLILSLFRFALYDERLYLHETVLMSELIKQGKWFGNYGVGVHGSLFKLPVALAYTITGPSIGIATFFHILLAFFSCVLFFRILWEHFKLRGWSLVGLVLFISTYSFLSWSITYHRETPALFTTMLFLKKFLEQKNNWTLGLFLILVIEAKEYVFFLISPPLVLWCFISCYQYHKKVSLKLAVDSISKCVKIFLPATLYIILMFATNVIPINMFLASIAGVTKNAISYQVKHISPMNYETKEDPGLYASLNKTIEKSIKPHPLKMVFKLGSAFLGYAEKPLYLSSFSFQSTPMIILIISLIFTFKVFSKWRNEKDVRKIFIAFFYWFYLIVYLLKVSQQRYMYPILAIAILFFTLALKSLYDDRNNNRLLNSSIALAIIYTVGLFVYPSNNPQKVLFEIFAHTLIIFTFILFLLYKKKLLIIITAMEIALCGVIYFSASSLLKNQIYKSLTWGVNGETDKIARLVSDKESIYINGTGLTNEYWMYNIKFFRKDPYLPPQWKWELLDIVPRKKSLLVLGEENTFNSFKWNNLRDLKKIIIDNSIDKVVMVSSNLEGVKFYNQNYISSMSNLDWLALERTEKLKNKTVYIFDVTVL